MRKKWRILKNLWRLWKNWRTVEKSALLMAKYGIEESALDGAPDEVLAGVNDMGNLHRVLSMNTGEFAQDLKKLKTAVSGCI